MLVSFGTSIFQDQIIENGRQPSRLPKVMKRRRRHSQRSHSWFSNQQGGGQYQNSQFLNGGDQMQAGLFNVGMKDGQQANDGHVSQYNWFASQKGRNQDQFQHPVQDQAFQPQAQAQDQYQPEPQSQDQSPDQSQDQSSDQSQDQSQSLKNTTADNANYTILDEPLVVPVDAVVEGANTTIRPRINLLIYGKIPKNMPLINLKLNVSKKFLENFDENGNPKPGFSIDMNQLRAENIPDKMPRPTQPNFIQIGAPRRLYDDNNYQPQVRYTSAFTQTQQSGQPYQQSSGDFSPVDDSRSFGYNRPVQPSQYQVGSNYPSFYRQSGLQCKPVPNIGSPIILVRKLLTSIDGQFKNPSTDTGLIFSQSVNDVYYLVFRSVATAHVAQYFGMTYNSKTDQVINFVTSPDIDMVASQLGITQLDANKTIPCGDLGSVYRNQG